MSSATIRNEMAALEEMGYLSHPHTSAGRIPTDAGYRHYVDSLPAGGRLRDNQRRAITGYFAEVIAGPRRGAEGLRAAPVAADPVRRSRRAADLADEPLARLELIDMGPSFMILAVGHTAASTSVMPRPARGRRTPRPHGDGTAGCRSCAA